MAKAKDSFYFQNFLESIRVSKMAADKLQDIIKNYNHSVIEEDVAAIHEIEHMGDSKKHEMTREIVKAFITPIDRDDIVKISNCIDNVTDSIEDIIINLYTWNIKELRPDVVPFAELISSCCDAAEGLLGELHDYKKSQKIMNHIIELNRLEEKGDDLYIQDIRTLSIENADPYTVMAWREIYRSFETVCDCCEDLADAVEAIIIANT